MSTKTLARLLVMALNAYTHVQKFVNNVTNDINGVLLQLTIVATVTSFSFLYCFVFWSFWSFGEVFRRRQQWLRSHIGSALWIIIITIASVNTHTHALFHVYLQIRRIMQIVGARPTKHFAKRKSTKYVSPIIFEGRRKNFVRKVLNERALIKIANEMNPKEVTNDGVKPSEYFDNFCDPQFTPLMDQSDVLVHNFIKYPLYASNNQTLYKEQIERGALKSRSEIANLNESFRRNCSFTTSPDQALREPTGGY